MVPRSSSAYSDTAASRPAIPHRAAAVLRRAGAVAPGDDRVGRARLRCRPVFLYPDLMPPGDVQVVFVGEPGAPGSRSAAKVTSDDEADSSQEP